MSELQEFLSSTSVFRDSSIADVERIAAHCKVEPYAAGATVLRQGEQGRGVFFIRTGRLAVRIQRGSWRETVATLQPPDVFGELSFVTNRAPVADVEVVVDAEVVLIPKDAFPPGSSLRDVILRGLTRMIAERLSDTMSRGAKAPESPVVLLHNAPHWEAPLAFATALAESLARQTGRKTLLVHLGTGADRPEPKSIGGNAAFCDLTPPSNDPGLRAHLAQLLTAWRRDFDSVVFNPVGASAEVYAEAVAHFVNFHGYLLSPGEKAPDEAADRFIVQSSVEPTLPVLDGSRQLVFEAPESESAFRSGGRVSPAFQRAADSIARRIAGIQVGIALGGGAAWGWAHIGVLQVLEEAGLPIDVITGCSMGSVIGGFRSAGFSIERLKEIAEYWRTRTRRFIEWRLWKMCLISEKAVFRVFEDYFQGRHVNQTQTPYWANAVDIQTGHQYTIQQGPLTECIRASISLPGLLSPFEKGEHLLVDAGITDPVPVGLLRRMGAHYALAVNAMAEMKPQKVKLAYPFNAFNVMTRCMMVMGHEIGDARAEQVADVLFTPSLGDITMLQFDRSPEIIECGRIATESRLEGIMSGYAELKRRQVQQPPAPH